MQINIEDRLHHELKSIFSFMPEVFAFKADQLMAFKERYKALSLSMLPPKNELVSISDQLIPGPGGSPDVRLRIHKPLAIQENLPGLLWIHGGGYIVGLPEMDDLLCAQFVLEANCIVVAVDYRLAPECPYPAPLDDCYAALKWMKDNSDLLGIDASRIGVAGASAGGGLAAAVALKARDEKGPSISFLMPLYPMINDLADTPSCQEITNPKVWNRDVNRIAWDAYIGPIKDDEIPPYAAVARATDLSGFPPTYTCVGDLDPFRDDTIEFVSKLTKAGVATEFHLYPGCFHGTEAMIVNAEISKHMVSQYVQAVKKGLQK